MLKTFVFSIFLTFSIFADYSSWTASSNDVFSSTSRFSQIAICNTTGISISVFVDRSGAKDVIRASYSTDGGVTWVNSSNALSDDSENADDPKIAINQNTGRAICIWRRYNGTNFVVQAAYSIDGGVSWTASSNDLSVADFDAFYPQIAIDKNSGRAICVWRKFNGFKNSSSL